MTEQSKGTLTVKQIRRSLHYSKDEMAEALGLNVMSYYKVERGKMGLDLEHLAILTKLSGISADRIEV